MITRMVIFFAIFIFSFLSEAHAKPSTEIYRDLPYTEQITDKNLQKLNLVIPKAEEKTPLLIWIGGGAWSYVDRNMEMDFAQKMADRGVAVAAVGHRLSPAIWKDPTLIRGVQHPAHINDVASAFTWLMENSENYNIDKSRIFVGGFSSGGHLAALLASDASYLKAHNLSVNAIKGVIPIGGSYDIPDYHRAFKEGSRPNLAVEHVEAVFGSTTEEMIAASPTSHVADLATPMLLISDSRTYNYTKLYEEALNAAEVDDLTVLHIRGLGHGQLWQHLSHDEESPYREIILSFVKTGLPKDN